MNEGVSPALLALIETVNGNAERAAVAAQGAREGVAALRGEIRAQQYGERIEGLSGEIKALAVEFRADLTNAITRERARAEGVETALEESLKGVDTRVDALEKARHQAAGQGRLLHHLSSHAPPWLAALAGWATAALFWGQKHT